jgi:hypothetical protein
MRRAIDLPGEDVLPPGALRTMTAALHDLYVGAGRPGTGRISKAINESDDYPGMISYERVRQLLRGQGGMPEWLRYLSVVRYLADHHTPARDRAEQEVRFKLLYDAAFAAAQTAQARPSSEPTISPASAQPRAHRVQDKPAPVADSPHTPATGGLELLKDSLRAHGGLPLHVVEEAARGLCTELQNTAGAIIADIELPADVLVEVKFMDGKPDTTYGGRPYQPLRTHQLGLTLMLSMDQPFKVRSVAGMHPGPTDDARQRIRAWVSGQVDLLFTTAATSYNATREAHGYREPAP